MMEAKTIEVVYEDGVFKPRGKLELATGTKVTFEITDTALLRERLKKYMGLLILKVKVSSAELNELYHEYVTERTDIP